MAVPQLMRRMDFLTQRQINPAAKVDLPSSARLYRNVGGATLYLFTGSALHEACLVGASV